MGLGRAARSAGIVGPRGAHERGAEPRFARRNTTQPGPSQGITRNDPVRQAPLGEVGDADLLEHLVLLRVAAQTCRSDATDSL